MQQRLTSREYDAGADAAAFGIDLTTYSGFRNIVTVFTVMESVARREESDDTGALSDAVTVPIRMGIAEPCHDVIVRVS